MGAYLYRAVDAGGRTSRGVIEATNAAAARRALRARSMVPLAVEPTRSSRLSGGGSRARIGRRALVLVTRQMATLIGAGVRVEDALATVAEQTTSAPVKSLLLNLRGAILDGRSFAAALDDHDRDFDAFYRASVRAGEASGTLDQVMDHLADHVERQAENRQTILLALLYPALLAVVSVSVIAALLVFVVPDIVRVFAARGVELPLPTRALIAASEGLGTYGPILAVSIAGLAGAAALVLRAPARRRAWHRWLAHAPVFGGFVRQVNAAQYAATLSTLIVSRVPLSEALEAAAATVSNLHVRARASHATTRVREGAALARAMREAEVFPPLLVAIVASGETSGRLGESLSRAADQQNRSLKATVSTIVGLVEPGVLLLMGGVVMLLVMSILLPIMDLNQLVE